jgi:hypothetical protein
VCSRTPHGVAQAPSRQLIAPVSLRPVGRIGQHYPGRQPGGDPLFDLFQCDRTLGSKVDLPRHSGLLAPIRVCEARADHFPVFLKPSFQVLAHHKPLAVTEDHGTI